MKSALDEFGQPELLCSDPLEILGFTRPGWMADALCREHPGLEWFPELPVNTRLVAEAKAVCRACLVRAECLSWALEHEEVGLWAATSTAERRRLRRDAARDLPVAEFDL